MPRSMPSLPSLQQLRVFDAVAVFGKLQRRRQDHPSVPTQRNTRRSDTLRKVGSTVEYANRLLCHVRRRVFLPGHAHAVANPAGLVRAHRRAAVHRPQQRYRARTQNHRHAGPKPDRHLRERVIRRAAARIEITEPSLHRSARTLERILRRTLYRRTAQGYTTTPPATELARRFKVAAREIEYGMDEIAAEHGPFVSRIVVGNIPHSDTHLLSAAINELLARFPQASVDVLDGHYNDLLNGLRHGNVDIVYGVLRRPKWAFDIEERFLFSNRYAVVARRDHPIRTLRRITTSDLARYDWIMPPKGTPQRHAFEQIFKERKIPPKVSVETTSMGIYRALLSSGADCRCSRIARWMRIERRGSKHCHIALRA